MSEFEADTQTVGCFLLEANAALKSFGGEKKTLTFPCKSDFSLISVGGQVGETVVFGCFAE